MSNEKQITVEMTPDEKIKDLQLKLEIVEKDRDRINLELANAYRQIMKLEEISDRYLKIIENITKQ